jgi:putative aminopeptidase FrvX
LPIVLAFDSAGTTARVLTPDGSDTEMRAVRTPSSGDSLTLRLRRIGYNGMLAMSAIGGARAGVMRSSQSTVHLEEVVTTSATEQKADERKAAASSARQPAAAPPVVAGANVAPAREGEASMGAAVSITARTVSCTRR